MYNFLCFKHITFSFLRRSRIRLLSLFFSHGCLSNFSSFRQYKALWLIRNRFYWFAHSNWFSLYFGIFLKSSPHSSIAITRNCWKNTCCKNFLVFCFVHLIRIRIWLWAWVVLISSIVVSKLLCPRNNLSLNLRLFVISWAVLINVDSLYDILSQFKHIFWLENFCWLDIFIQSFNNIFPIKWAFYCKHINFFNCIENEGSSSIGFRLINTVCTIRKIKDRRKFWYKKWQYPAAVWIFFTSIAKSIVFFTMPVQVKKHLVLNCLR